jgi:hypothetical protein
MRDTWAKAKQLKKFCMPKLLEHWFGPYPFYEDSTGSLKPYLWNVLTPCISCHYLAQIWVIRSQGTVPFSHYSSESIRIFCHHNTEKILLMWFKESFAKLFRKSSCEIYQEGCMLAWTEGRYTKWYTHNWEVWRKIVKGHDALIKDPICCIAYAKL